jgi:hypothetical protein
MSHDFNTMRVASAILRQKFKEDGTESFQKINNSTGGAIVEPLRRN